MSKERTREWRFYLQDMVAFGEKVIAYTDLRAIAKHT